MERVSQARTAVPFYGTDLAEAVEGGCTGLGAAINARRSRQRLLAPKGCRVINNPLQNSQWWRRSWHGPLSSTSVSSAGLGPEKSHVIISNHA